MNATIKKTAEPRLEDCVHVKNGVLCERLYGQPQRQFFHSCTTQVNAQPSERNLFIMTIITR